MDLNNRVSPLQIVPVREAFPHEALNFTVWLENNIEALAARIGFDLTVLEREKAVGPFNVDLYCEDEFGRLVIIENQLERTDHDHLGKLMTYLVNLDANAAIWVTPEVRPEHERVIDWLNEMAGANTGFYLVRVEAVRIGDSPYAPLFTVLAGPDEELQQVGEEKKEWAERHVNRYEFWTQLLERAATKGLDLFTNISPSRNSHISTGAGRSGFGLTFLILKDGAGIQLYIDMGNHDRNKTAFDALLTERDAIEAEFGEVLDWRRLDDKRASRIVKIWRDQGNLDEPDQWPALQDSMIDAMLRFEKAMRPRIQQLKV